MVQHGCVCSECKRQGWDFGAQYYRRAGVVDLGLFRNFNFTERIRLQFRAEATNAFNFVNLNNPTTGQNSATFGQIRSARAMRQLQFGLRLSF